MPYYVRPMTREDVAQVTKIDQEAFPTQWPPADYQYEIRNRLAHYIVACNDEIEIDRPVVKSASTGLGTIFHRLFHRPLQETDVVLPPVSHYIVGFAGFWIMADEAHITSIAVREAYRRRGIGELLLIAVIDLSLKLKAGTVTLEVRLANTAAQNLYTKYGFNKVGLRKGYYIDRHRDGDSKEDGLIMTTEDINSGAFQVRLRQLRQAYAQKWALALSRSGK